jgi:hypothetical protein
MQQCPEISLYWMEDTFSTVCFSMPSFAKRISSVQIITEIFTGQWQWGKYQLRSLLLASHRSRSVSRVETSHRGQTISALLMTGAITLVNPMTNKGWERINTSRCWWTISTGLGWRKGRHGRVNLDANRQEFEIGMMVDDLFFSWGRKGLREREGERGRKDNKNGGLSVDWTCT